MSYIGNSPYQVAFVTDTFSGNGSTTAFTMSVAPANTASVLVVVSGVVQDPSTYSVSGTTLTFTAAPPSATGNISCRYLGIPASGVTTTAYRTVTEFTATAGQTTFTPPSYTAGFINVYRNGALLGSADYTATNGTTVVLASAASASDLVTVESFLVSSVLNAIPATAGSVGSTYLAGGAALANIGAGGITQSYLATSVAGTGPAFRAYPSTSQTINHGVATKISWGSESYDTAGAFSSSTFTAPISGYYQLSAVLNLDVTNSRSYYMPTYIYKNGSSYSYTENATIANVSGRTAVAVSDLLYLAATDYIDIYLYSYDYTATTTVSVRTSSYFNGCLVRAA